MILHKTLLIRRVEKFNKLRRRKINNKKNIYGFTYRTYARFIDEDAPEAGNKFASLISPKSELKIASK